MAKKQKEIIVEESPVVKMGNDAEALLNNEIFISVMQDLMNAGSTSILRTTPDQKDMRERAYMFYVALNDILLTLNTRVQNRDEELNPSEKTDEEAAA